MTKSAFEALSCGELCIVATDTVFGLAAVPGSPGFEEIFKIKGRPREQVLPWLVKDERALVEYGANVSDYVFRLADAVWPGACTLVVRANDRAEQLGEVAADGTLALRVPADENCLFLMDRVGLPLACTSANIHGQPSASRKDALPASFKSLAGFDDLPQACAGGQASSILDCTGDRPRILREGPLDEELVFRLAGM